MKNSPVLVWDGKTIIFCKSDSDAESLYDELLVHKLPKNIWGQIGTSSLASHSPVGLSFTQALVNPSKSFPKDDHVAPHLNSSLTQMAVWSMPRIAINIY